MIYPIVIVGSLVIVAAWEAFCPRRRLAHPAARRRLANVALWLVNVTLAGVLLGSPAEMRRLLNAPLAAHLPSWPIADAGLGLVVGFLLLDLVRYLVHRCEHSVWPLWRLHALHHSDPDVDVTTALRHNPAEYAVGSAVYWLVLVVLDVPGFVVLCHAVVLFACEAVQHGNIRLPQRVERWLRPLLVTTEMHRIHHSVVFGHANANYGAVLSVWDRLFGTYLHLSREQHDALVFGLPEPPPYRRAHPVAAGRIAS